MKTNSKIQAFTLSEMIVVLILTTVVVGLAFSVLSLVQKHMYSIQKNFNANVELNKLETSLWLDFNRYHKVEYSATDNELKLASELDSIRYRFSDTYVVKANDTFNIQVENKLFYFGAQPIEEGQIDAIELVASKRFQNQKLFIWKNNSAKAYMD